MTARSKARVLMLVSVVLLLAGGGYAYISGRRVARLRALQTATQVALQEGYRLTVESTALLHSTGSILQTFQDWKDSLARNEEDLKALAGHSGLKLLSPELSERAQNVERVWDTLEAGQFVPVRDSLDLVLANAPLELGSQGVAAGRPIARDDPDLLVSFYLDMVRAEKGLTTGVDTLGPFVTNVLGSLSREIGVETDKSLLRTIRVAAASVAVLVLSVVAALLYSVGFLDQANRGLEDTVRQRTRSIQSLLDFSGRGFLSFGSDLTVRPEHSRDCEAILGERIIGRRLPDLLYPEGQAREDFAKAMDLVFSGRSRPEVIFDLIDKEVRLRGRVIELDFRVIDPGTLMCSLEDVTERRKLQDSVAEQREVAEMVLRIAMNRRSFVSLTREAEVLFRDLHDLETPGLASRLSEDGHGSSALQALHTFKANAAFLRMKGTAEGAHALEQNLQDRLLVGDASGSGDGLSSLLDVYTSEVSAVSERLGEDWIREPDTVVVRREQLASVERLVRTAHPGDGALYTALEAMRMVPIHELLERYDETVQNLARSRAKRIRPISVVGGATLVLPEQFSQIEGCILHILRNMVDHGIESPAERREAGKEPEGLITVEAKAKGSGLEITISDDGRGVSVRAVAARARKMGMLQPGARPTRRELLLMIFEPGFSTAEVVSAISGRGVGLAAVRETVGRLGGRLGFSTREGRGTTFTIFLPISVEGP